MERLRSLTYVMSCFFQITTVNCARVILPDQIATNGILHVTDKVRAGYCKHLAALFTVYYYSP